MLQITPKIFLLFAGLSLSALGADSLPTVNPDWLLDESLDEGVMPIEIPHVTTPADFKRAQDHYRAGNYRLAVVEIEKERELNLPDGRMDFLLFALGECYRALGIRDAAFTNYQSLLEKFPESDKVAPALFRRLQFAYEDRNASLADSILEIFENDFKVHPLYNSAVYIIGKLYYRNERYGEATEYLLNIPKTSSRHFQGQFLSALCFIRLGMYDKALLHLEYVRKNCLDATFLAEANVVTGDIYYLQKNLQAAMRYYMSVPKDAARQYYVQVKIARIYYESKLFDRARLVAEDFIKRHRQGEYFFEMASILEQVYSATGEKTKATRINNSVYRQIVNARLAFEIDKELGSIKDMERRWRNIELNAEHQREDELTKTARKNLDRLAAIERENRRVLSGVDGIIHNADGEVSGLSERRYLTE
jgi:tetratricopeptide (TPR) repeat protein